MFTPLLYAFRRYSFTLSYSPFDVRLLDASVDSVEFEAQPTLFFDLHHGGKSCTNFAAKASRYAASPESSNLSHSSFVSLDMWCTDGT